MPETKKLTENSHNEQTTRIHSLEELLLRSMTKNREDTVDRYNQQMANIKTYLWLATAIFAAIYYVFSNDITVIVKTISINSPEVENLLADFTVILCVLSIGCCAYAYAIGIKEITGDEVEVHEDRYLKYLEDKFGSNSQNSNIKSYKEDDLEPLEEAPANNKDNKKNIQGKDEKVTRENKKIQKNNIDDTTRNLHMENIKIKNNEDKIFSDIKYADYLSNTIVNLNKSNRKFQNNISRRGNNMRRMNISIIFSSIFFFISLIFFHALKLYMVQ